MKTKLRNLILILTIVLSSILTFTIITAADMQVNSTIVTLPGTQNIEKPSGIVVTENGSVLFTSTTSHKVYSQTLGDAHLFAGFDVYDDAGQPLLGLHDGQADQALFHSPAGMDIDSDGNIYIADAMNHAIRVIRIDGEVETIAGDGLFGDSDGNKENARFYQPMDVAVANDGTIYVADTLNHVIRKIDTEGNVTTLTKKPDRLVEVNDNLVISGGDYQDGLISNAMFNEPTSLVLDENGNLYVADSGNNFIRYIDFENNLVSTIAGSANAYQYNDTTLYLDGGYEDGNLENAKFQTPRGIAITDSGNLVVVDSGNSHIRYINLAEQTVETLTSDGDLLYPSDVAITQTGDLVVTDTRNNEVKKIVLWDKPKGFGSYLSIEKAYDDDSSISEYAKVDVYRNQRLGFMVGSLGDKYVFSPQKEITRGQFASVIVKALNLDLLPAGSEFSDVNSTSWYAPYVETAFANGIVNGYGDGAFGPEDPITRQQIAIIIAKAMNWTSDLDEQVYQDQEHIWDNALPMVLALYEKGIIVGDELHYFNPTKPVTREMAAVIMARLVEHF